LESGHNAQESMMHKQVIKADVPEAGATFNQCVKHGNLIFVSGLPPFDAEFSAQLRAARANKQPLPPFPDIPFERQVRIVMDHLKKLVEAAGSNMGLPAQGQRLAEGPAPAGGIRPRLPDVFHQPGNLAGAHPPAGRPHAA
jgi:hypothetical protein